MLNHNQIDKLLLLSHILESNMMSQLSPNNQMMNMTMKEKGMSPKRLMKIILHRSEENL